MAKWTIIWNQGNEGTIAKNDISYIDVNVSWLPSNILAVHSDDGTQADIEYGDRTKHQNTTNEEDISTSSLSWWSNVETTWQEAYDLLGEPD